MYMIENENVYDDFYNDKELFDFCNCAIESRYYDDLNNLIVGKMKKWNTWQIGIVPNAVNKALKQSFQDSFFNILLRWLI